MEEGCPMGNKNYKKGNTNEKNTENMKEIEKLKRRITELNRLIVEFEFDNRNLRMEITFLFNKLEHQPPTEEDYESCY